MGMYEITNDCKIEYLWIQQELSNCWDGRSVLHISNFTVEYGIPLLNALSFSVIPENINVSHVLSKSRFFGLHFCLTHYGSNFKHCKVAGPIILPNFVKWHKISAITLFKVIQGHQFRYQFKASRQCDFLYVNSNFSTVTDISRTGLLVHFSLSTGNTPLQPKALVRSEPLPKFMIAKFDLRKLLRFDV